MITPTPPRTIAMPSPNAMTSTIPKAVLPTTIVPRRMTSAFAEGTIPPARPMRNEAAAIRDGASTARDAKGPP